MTYCEIPTHRYYTTPQYCNIVLWKSKERTVRTVRSAGTVRTDVRFDVAPEKKLLSFIR